MNYKAEMTLPKEAKQDAASLFELAKKIPPEKQAGFLEFLRGVGYGLEIAAHQREDTQASA